MDPDVENHPNPFAIICAASRVGKHTAAALPVPQKKNEPLLNPIRA